MPATPIPYQWINSKRITPGLIFLLVLIARLVPGPRTIDDAYITYRYARNILALKGFVYNPGERVLGTTTPLYTLLLTGVGIFAGETEAPFPEIAWLINALADGITCILLYQLGKRLGFPLAGLGAALIWAIAPFSVTFAIGGLETSIYVLLLTATICAYIHERFVLGAFYGALALLTRPDALILLGPLAIDRIFVVFQQLAYLPKDTATEKGTNTLKIFSATLRNLRSEALAFLLPTLNWFSFATIYFGNLLPQSIIAKTRAYHLAPESGFIRLLQHYATPFLGHLTFGNAWIGVGFVLYLFLSLVGMRASLRATHRIWPAIVYPWLYLLIFSLANPLIFRWYLTPPLPMYMLTILIGTDQILNSVTGSNRKRKDEQVEQGHQRKRPSTSSLVVRTVLVIIIPFALNLQAWTLHPDHGLNRPAPDMAWYKLELLYRQAAEYLSQEVGFDQRENFTLAAGDVGVLGYFTGMRILDTVGLNSPQSTKYYPLPPDQYVINYAIPAQLILDEKPHFLVILEVYGRESLLLNPLFQETYEIIQTIPTDIYSSRGMLIIRRRSD